MFHLVKKIVRRCKEILIDFLSRLQRGKEASPVQETALGPTIVDQHVPDIHHNDSVPDTEAVEAPLHDVDDNALEPEPAKERLHFIPGDVRERLMVERHTPTILKDHGGVLEDEGIEELSRDTDDNELESGIVKERLSPIQDNSDALKFPMSEQQSPAEQDDNSTPDPEAVQSQLLINDDDALEFDIIERSSHTEQDSIPEGNFAETVPHASTDSTPAPATVERRIPELPIELCEDIIGFLDYWDVETIANCALVCRQWVPFSRFKLYRYVRLHYRWQWTAFERLILLSASSDMAGYLGKVKQLWIYPKDEKFLDKEETQPRIGWRKGQERPWTHVVLVECAARLPAVTRIDFLEMDWSEHYHAPGLRSGRDWHSLTTLELNVCRFASVAQLHLFVTAFPALADLTLKWIELNSKESLHISKGGHPLMRLQLAGYGVDMAEVTRWLAGAPNLVQKLADLNWWPDNADQWKALTEAIDESTLERLELRQVPEDWLVDWYRFTHLRVLKLGYINWPLQSHLESVSNVLGSISSNQLEELDISVLHSSKQISLETTIAAFTWFKAIDGLLASPRFTHLLRVALEYKDLDIHIQAIPDTSPPPSGGSIMPISGSSSRPDPSDQFVSTPPASSPEAKRWKRWGPQHPFKLYAEPLVQRKIRDELKQLDARGILEVKVTVRPQEQETQMWGRTRT